jgi:hypothetical protein
MRRNKPVVSRSRILSLLATLAALGMILGGYGGPGPVTAAFHVPAAEAPRPEVLVVRLFFHDTAERDRLATAWGADEEATGGGYLTVWADRATYDAMLAQGLRVEIDQETTRQANMTDSSGLNSPTTFYGGYKTVEEMETFLDQKVAAYPTLAAKVDVGNSWCKDHPGTCTRPAAFNGYDLWALHITNQAIPGPKPVFWYDAAIHAREIATPEVAMRFINWLLDNYNTDPDAHWLVDYHDIWVMPMLNPDGHHIVEAGGGGSSPYYQRKNADNDDGCTTWPPSSSNHFGTDLNRNFPFLWACCGGSGSYACGETYHGPSAGSEVEVQYVMNKIRELIPDQRGPLLTDAAPITTTGVIQNMHSYAGLNLFPWGQTTQHTANDADLRNIGAHISALNAGGNGYDYGQPPEILYAVDGDSLGWAYGELGAAAYTTELNGNGFFPAYSTVDARWNENKGMLTYLAKIARTPYLTTRGPDTNGPVISGGGAPQGIPAALSATINYAWTANTYLQNVAAAEYYIDTPPWAGGTPVAMTATDGTFNASTEAVQAAIDTAGLTVGRHIVFVRGRGVNSYSGFPSWGPVSAVFLDVSPSEGTATPTATHTATPPPTATAVATDTPTATVPPTATDTPTPTVPPAATHTPTVAASATATPPGATATPAVTETPCAITFTDVSTEYFAEPVRYLACHGIISGYSNGDGTLSYRPYNATTRGQMVKIMVNAFGVPLVTPAAPTFQDVPPAHPFYRYIEAAAAAGIVSGYTCGAPGEPCPGAYFRPNNDVTRGQLSKIVVNTAGWALLDPPVAHFRDVPPGSVFYPFVETAVCRGLVSGYDCGPGCYEFRPANNATRGQIAKIAYNAITGAQACATPAAVTR